jgi:radical SAM superfamily enzyme YgiQ (UPF0313 family)
MPKTDVLLINPGGRLSIFQALAADLAAIEPPVWAGLIAAYLRQKGIHVRILDANAEDLCPEEVAQRVAGLSPLLCAVVVYGHNPSASTQQMPSAGAICRAVKRRTPAQAILLIGGHVASLPERTLREEACDFVCGGEGPVTIGELVQELSRPRPHLESVRGLLYRKLPDGKIVANPAAPLVTRLDEEMPGIAWDLLPMDRYRAHNWHCFEDDNRRPYAALYTSLGCPFRCRFCCIHAPFKSGESVSGFKNGVNSYRLWSPQAVIAEIDTLVRQYGVRHIKFADELFVLNSNHVNGICDLIIGRGYDLNIWAYARVDTLQDSMLQKLKAAGVRWLALGIESASDRVRGDSAKGFAAEKVFEAVARIRAAGIHIGANYIFGLPEDNHESMRATLDLAIGLNTEWANFNCAMAYPGSPLYQDALQSGWPLPGDWSGYSQYSVDSLPLRTRHLAAAEVLRFRDEAFRTYFSNPRYQELIRRKFGEPALRHVRDMLKHKLERNNAPPAQPASTGEHSWASSCPSAR